MGAAAGRARRKGRADVDHLNGADGVGFVVVGGTGMCSAAGTDSRATLPPLEVARIAQRAENDYVGAPTGLLDQLSSLYGRADTALLVDFSSLEVTEVPMDLGDAHRLLVIDSHAPHQNVAGEYAKRRLSCENAARELGVPSLREVDPEAGGGSVMSRNVLEPVTSSPRTRGFSTRRRLCVMATSQLSGV